MEEAPVSGGSKKWKFKSDEAISAAFVSSNDKPAAKVNTAIKPLRSPDSHHQTNSKFYQRRQQGSPILEVRSRFTFGTTECLHNGGEQQPSQIIAEKQQEGSQTPLLSKKFQDASSLSSAASANLPKTVPFGRSRRMSKSLPELRDLQFVSVLPDVEEEESDISESQDEVVYEKPTRVPWHRKLDFVWCSACHALGFGNMWRFPYYCYSNGGGSFVWPYLIFVIICGVPFLCMELAIGQLTQSGPISAIGQLCPLMKGIGVASMMLSFWLTTYYSVLTSWTLFYTFNSFYSPPRWTRCTNTWNTDRCHSDANNIEANTFSSSSPSSFDTNVTHLAAEFLNVNDSAENRGGTTEMYNDLFIAANSVEGNVSSSTSPTASMSLQSHSSLPSSLFERNLNLTHPAAEFFNIKMLERTESINDSGELRFEILASVLFVWVLTYIALRKTDFFRGRVIYILTIVSHLILFSIFLRTVALEGGKDGLNNLFQPDWNQIFNPRVLLYALAQAFHSLGVVLGPSILMGSCHKQNNNLMRDTIILTSITLVTVLIIGCISFTTIGHLALKMNKPFWTVLSDDPGNVFVLYSIVIGSMPLPSCWAVFFFLALLFLGLDSEIKLMATLVSALKEAYTYYIKQRFQGHTMFLAVICGICFVACIPYLTQAGIFFFQLIDYYTAVIATPTVALFEVCTLGLLYGTGNLSSCIQQMTGKTPSFFYQFCWMVLTPFAIAATLLYWCIKASSNNINRDYIYPQWAHILGWILFGSTLCWIPFLAIAAYRKAIGGDILSKLRSSIQPRSRSASDCRWTAKPVIILNGSTVTASEFPDYKLPELPPVTNAVQSYVEKHSNMHQNNETAF